jgi:hypothetical protein
MQALAILVAAGRGERMGAGRPKAFRDLAGEPLLLKAAQVFERAPSVGAIVAVVPSDEVEAARALLAAGRSVDARVVGARRRGTDDESRNDGKAAAQKLRRPREPATIDANTAAALQVSMTAFAVVRPLSVDVFRTPLFLSGAVKNLHAAQTRSGRQRTSDASELQPQQILLCGAWSGKTSSTARMVHRSTRLSGLLKLVVGAGVTVNSSTTPVASITHSTTMAHSLSKRSKNTTLEVTT